MYENPKSQLLDIKPACQAFQQAGEVHREFNAFQNQTRSRRRKPNVQYNIEILKHANTLRYIS